MRENKNIKVLIAPLDWGLGHATRCIPLINEFIHHNCKVILAGEGPSLNLLRQEFPDLPYIHLRGYRVKIPGKTWFPFYFLLHLCRFIFRIYKEHKDLDRIILEHKPDVIISDNRYGLWNKKIYCIFITHQLNIIPPRILRFSGPVLRRITRLIVQKYNKCWIVDHEKEPNLSGELSHGNPVPLNASYIGLLSRFESLNGEHKKEQYDILGIISGPEPQRSNFEAILTNEFKRSKLKTIIIRGIPSKNSIKVSDGNLTIVNHLPFPELYNILNETKVVICRSGYSTLMDMAFTGNKIICIPTPGQTEQEYLAMRCAQNNQVLTIQQKDFNLAKCISLHHETTGLSNLASSSYRNEIKTLIEEVMHSKVS